jgi:subtilase family serine protease
VAVLAGCGGGTPSNAAPANTKVLVALALKVRDHGLAVLAGAAADAQDRGFRRFHTISQIAAAYGAPAAVIAADQKLLAADGLQLRLDATHAALWGSVTAAQAKRYFGTTLIESHGVIEPASTPQVPRGLTGVTGVVGLDASASSTPAVTGGSAMPPCPAQVPSRSAISKLFGFQDVIAAGATGAGTAIDILAVHTFQPAVFENFNRCSGTALNSSNISSGPVPDTPRTGGGPEIALDSLVLTLLAPSTRLHITQFDPSTPLAFPLMQTLDGSSTPNVLDITVTYCETKISPAERSLSEWLLSAFAATGTTTAAASGDTGSSGCYPTTSPSVTYPASSAFVAAIGGASYSDSASDPKSLTVWNTPGSAAGGGGVSAVVAAPPWQRANKRQVPDVSAYAVPGGVGSVPVCASSTDCIWSAVGGTSLAATVMGGAGVLLEQRAGERGRAVRWGNVAGAIWRRTEKTAAIPDIVDGSNSAFTTACCKAKAGYDIASGWGLLDPDSLTEVVPPG